MADSTPTRKRIRNPEITREKLLKATVDLVASKGVDALSMKEVAERAAVSRSMAYVHFQDRDHLIKEAREWMSNRLRDGVERFDSDNSVLEDRILYTTETVMRDMEASRVMIMDALAGGGLGLHNPLFNAVRSRLAEAQERGDLGEEFDIEVLTFIHFGGSIASALLYREHYPDADVVELAARFAENWSKVLRNGMFTDTFR